MKKQSSKPATRRTRGVVLGMVAAGVALTTTFALAGVTPSSAYEAVFAPQNQPAKVTAPSDVSDTLSNSQKGTASARRADKTPEIGEAIGVPPAKPKPNDAELGRTPQKKNKAVKLTDKVQVLDGMTIGIANLAAVQGVADEPGEVAGDAVRVSVTLTNTGTAPADTSGVLVDLEAGPQAIPGQALRGAGTTTLPTTIEPGASATADYVFVVESNQRARVSVLVNYSVTAPVAVFEGTAPPAKGKQ